jgi:RNA polymerase-binding transcription factor DksA
MKIQICEQCFLFKPVNSRGICGDCTFRNNHNGKSQQEVYSERARELAMTHVKKSFNPKEHVKKLPNTTKKSRKAMNNSFLKDERLEKRREQIRKDEETYEQVFNSNPHQCEECGAELPDQFRDDEGNVLARFQYSHIVTKKACPEFRNDPRNFNRLCFTCHQTWEFGDRVEMKIYPKNQETVDRLRKERFRI